MVSSRRLLGSLGLRQTSSNTSPHRLRRGSAMRLPFRIWRSLFSSWARLQQGRKQRRAAARKRRSLQRRHELTALEQRVVLNAAPVANDDVFQTTEEVAVPFFDDDL